MIIHDVRFTPASPQDKVAGLIGFVSVALGPVRIDGITVRRSREGRYSLSYPERRDGAGRPHSLVRPISGHARAELEHVVLSELHQRGFIVWPAYRSEAAS